MKTITCKNQNGINAVFTYEHDKNEYFLVSCEGIYSIKNNISRASNATTDGAAYQGSAVEERNIVIRANIIRNHRNNREYLSKVFKTNEEGIFIYEENGSTRKIKYRVESLEVAETGIIRPVTISLLCLEPYFTDEKENRIDMSKWCDDFEFEMEIPESGMEFGHRQAEKIKQIDNESTKDTGIIITLQADGKVKNPSICNQSTNEALLLECIMQPEDIIKINTMEGEMTVDLIREGKIMDFNYTVNEDKDQYIQLRMGRNVIYYEAEEGEDFLNVSISYYNKYLFA